MWLDKREQAEAFGHQFRMAVLSADPDRFADSMYPEFFEEEVTEDDDLSDTSGTWKFESAPAAADAERLLAEMIADPTGVLTGGEVDEWR